MQVILVSVFVVLAVCCMTECVASAFERKLGDAVGSFAMAFFFIALAVFTIFFKYPF